MNRNTEAHFSQLPNVDIQRSIFKRDSSHTTTLNVGDLVPIYLDEILPGDTVSITTSKVLRLQTMLTPIMSNLYADFSWWFVPNDIIWSHWKEFCGENTESAWVPETTYTMPKIASPEGGWSSGTLADYMGIPVGVEFKASGESPDLNYDHFPSSLPFRAYAKIVNDFWRDENLTDPLVIPDGDSLQTGSNGTDYIEDIANGGMPFKAAKYHDYFTSCLPSPQKGDAVQVPLPQGFYGNLPVKTQATSYENILQDSSTLDIALKKYNSTSEKYESTGGTYTHLFKAATGSQRFDPNAVATNDSNTDTSLYYFDFANLGVDIPRVTDRTGFSINELRLAFAAQKMLEKNARGGSRYVEILKSHFGVTSPDARLQRPEYLGGNRVPVQIHQVTNNAQSEQDFLGDLGAMSYTADVHADFEKSFTEHGYLMCLCVLRYDHTYSQGLERMWTRNLFTDFYLPVFSNIGEQPVYKDEIYCDGEAPDVFGYNEAWAEYRYKPNRVSAEMRPGIPNTLASWHLGDYYTEAPTLSDTWIREDKTNVDRVLAVTSSVSNQALLDVFFDATYTRPMPMYSIPGLIDRN